MRTLILAALAATTTLAGIAAPVAASAQSRHDPRGAWRHDDRRPDDRRWNGRHDAPRYGRDHRWGQNDWRGYRDQHRRLYARGNWHAPFRYNSFRIGGRIAPSYYGSRYAIADPWRYRLPPVRPGQRWVRHYDDVLLVDTRRGRVVQVIRGFYW
ncbi:RcnB family protein [Sphingomonas sp. ac-8]|uniref:RcnB family protein n=1 Tax=Sphingomonas sp. ac-8 TaxID=3242977 RepID=UPI003A810CDE